MCFAKQPVCETRMNERLRQQRRLLRIRDVRAETSNAILCNPTRLHRIGEWHRAACFARECPGNGRKFGGEDAAALYVLSTCFGRDERRLPERMRQALTHAGNERRKCCGIVQRFVLRSARLRYI